VLALRGRDEARQGSRGVGVRQHDGPEPGEVSRFHDRVRGVHAVALAHGAGSWPRSGQVLSLWRKWQRARALQARKSEGRRSRGGRVPQMRRVRAQRRWWQLPQLHARDRGDRGWHLLRELVQGRKATDPSFFAPPEERRVDLRCRRQRSKARAAVRPNQPERRRRWRRPDGRHADRLARGRRRLVHRG